MSEYKRLISYLYAYDVGVKTINVGFAKAELRGGILKLSVVLKNVMFAKNKIRISFFSRIDNEWIRTLISDIELMNGQGELHIRLSEDELNAKNIIFNNISGIIVTEQDNEDYVIMSLWQEILVSPYDILRDYKESIRKETVYIEDNINSNNNYDCYLNDTNDKVILSKEDISTNINPNNNNTNCENSKEIIYEAAVIKEDNIFSDNMFYELKKIKPEELSECLNSITASEVSSSSLNELKSKVDNIVDAAINNSFLMHGYYNYDHIITGKSYDNDRNEELIMIGVPGIFHEKEQFMASIFGFPEFKEINKSMNEDMEYNGYWYKMMSI